jgi:hypothetical protein
MAAQAAVVPRSSGLKARGRSLARGVPSRGRLPLDPKHVITVMGLLRHVRLDDLVSDVVAPAAQGASCPAMAAPQALPHGWKCGEQTRGTFALHPLDEATDLDMRGERAHPMAMLWRAMPVEDIAPRLLTCFADTSAAPFRTSPRNPLWRSLVIQT